MPVRYIILDLEIGTKNNCKTEMMNFETELMPSWKKKIIKDLTTLLLVNVFVVWGHCENESVLTICSP